jgi:hypothetical protein
MEIILVLAEGFVIGAAIFVVYAALKGFAELRRK